MIDLYTCLDNGIKLLDISERSNNKSGGKYVLVSVFFSQNMLRHFINMKPLSIHRDISHFLYANVLHY